jgi:hypothetical protein
MREAFDEFISMDVYQKEVENKTLQLEVPQKNNLATYPQAMANLPKSNYTSYIQSNKRFLLRKTISGYTLYQEGAGVNNDLLLKGKIILKDATIIFEDSQQKKLKVEFDEFYNLNIGEGNDKVNYKYQN